MIRVLSFIIACILTVLLALALYPIAAFFWAISLIGDAVGVFSHWIFSIANRIIKYLWADLKKESNIGPPTDIFPENFGPFDDDSIQQ